MGGKIYLSSALRRRLSTIDRREPEKIDGRVSHLAIKENKLVICGCE